MGRNKLTVDFSAKHRGVSGSCIPVTINHPDGNIRFLVDFGSYLGEEEKLCEEEKSTGNKNYEPLDFSPGNLDFVILTHCHADHNGRLPILYKKQGKEKFQRKPKEPYSGKIYTTVDTSNMLPIAMEDNEKIVRIYAKRKGIKPLYTSKEVEQVLSNTVPCEFGETFYPIPYRTDVKVTFYPNGHLVGAAITLVQITCRGKEEGINILFTGDFKKDNIFFDVPELPEKVKRMPLYVVCESTYGATDTAQVVPVFNSNINRWLHEDKKTILILSLSLERFQSTAYNLKVMQNSFLDRSIPIYFDGGLAIKYNNLYKYKLGIKESMKDFMPDNSTYVCDDMRKDIINSPEKKIIVATSGMGSFGPAQEYLPNLVERSDVGIHYTSYLSKDTTGYRMVNAEKEVLISSVFKRKIADVQSTSEFSKHAKRDEMLEFLSQFQNIRGLFINHGELDVQFQFAKYCQDNLELGENRIMLLSTGDTIRCNEYGWLKTFHNSVI